MKTMVVWALHFPAGSIAVIAAFLAFYYPKGSALHRKAGNYFTLAMLILLVSGGIAGWLKNSVDDVFLAALVSYSVFTAWLTTHRRPGHTGKLEILAVTYVLSLGTLATLVDESWGTLSSPNFFIMVAILCVCFALGDLANLYKAGYKGAKRLARHVWRQGFSLLWAGLAFGDKLIKMTHGRVDEQPLMLLTPGVFMLLVTLYWLYRLYRQSNSLVITN